MGTVSNPPSCRLPPAVTQTAGPRLTPTEGTLTRIVDSRSYDPARRSTTKIEQRRWRWIRCLTRSSPTVDSCRGHQARTGRSRRPARPLVRPRLRAWDETRRGVAVFGRDFTTLFRFAVIRTRPNRSTSWACARSAAGIHASHVSSGRSRFGRALFQQEVHRWGGFEPYVRDDDISCGRQIRHLHEVERDWPTLEEPSVHENPESPPRLLERAKSVGDLEQDPYLSHRSKSRSSLDEPGLSRVALRRTARRARGKGCCDPSPPRERRCSQRSARSTRRAVPAPGSTARKGSAAFRRPTPDGSYSAVSVPMRSR